MCVFSSPGRQVLTRQVTPVLRPTHRAFNPFHPPIIPSLECDVVTYGLLQLPYPFTGVNGKF